MKKMTGKKQGLFRGIRWLVPVMSVAVGVWMFAVPATAAGVPSAYEVQQQKLRVKGRVLDVNGEPLIGVNVFEKGAVYNGVVTGMDGDFELTVTQHSTLVFSYIGYKTVEMVAQDQRFQTVTLQEDTEALDEIVVIGYGAVRKADLAGSVAVMDNKSFKDQPVARV